MAAYDWNGTGSTPIANIADWNGTAGSQINIVHDFDGTTRRLVYSKNPVDLPYIYKDGKVNNITGGFYKPNYCISHVSMWSAPWSGHQIGNMAMESAWIYVDTSTSGQYKGTNAATVNRISRGSYTKLNVLFWAYESNVWNNYNHLTLGFFSSLPTGYTPCSNNGVCKVLQIFGADAYWMQLDISSIPSGYVFAGVYASDSNYTKVRIQELWFSN